MADMFVPDYLMREQAMVGALVAFVAVRIGLGRLRGEWVIRARSMNLLYLGLTALYCSPQLVAVVLRSAAAQTAWPVIEGKLLGCTVAYFCGALLYRKLRAL